LSCGLLLLDKPAGLSSNGATQRVRRLLREAKAGHVGSLDPLATGMLPICLGEATKLAGEVLDGAKTYSFRIALGRRTATGDTEGEVVETAPVPLLEPARLRQVLDGFLGESLQVPPMYSALKRDGRPLYELARAGVTVERAARPIHIERLELRGAGADWLDCEVRCGKGTYVRTLAEDVARALGSCGHVAWLRRESVEPFEAASMVALEDLERAVAESRPPPLLAPEVAVAHLPPIALSEEFVRRMRLGQAVRVAASLPPGAGPRQSARPGGGAAPGEGAQTDAAAPSDTVDGAGAEWTVRLHGSEGGFLGLGWARGDGRIRAKRLFVEAAAGP
jgi:tRNA pseudouridine55 synthase